MASACISSCVDDARVPVRATYVNLYKWPESDFEFVRSMSSKSGNDGKNSKYGHPRVVDSISCRQMYLRSYTFSREEDYREEKSTIKCLGRGRDHAEKRTNSHRGGDGRRSKSAGLKKAKSVSCSALTYIFRRLLSCTTEIDVAN
ncbi:hypothetical protein C2S52_016591 [Perilla frutescens var. hirtella]|uniref:Uncharacterized protein n=1 Tax=Perilla frutescens var. hirtella TaxID=608512 RepID=A0AAD4JML3_PERFH|nr:hypothetical protein C2S52_016591 [Perilla frutescens var. hirtella]KAH6810448.1 hypothetical protein C2S51_024210 [Perilla frutescens var. frutescens]KAH6814587.1 hypothetical protein C2S51_023605 [Perilla frutescens var. frutescens]KAH6836563.1 hypothetical protein C2S53_005182 [Perilla frutescens var. hirtella]